MSNPYKQIEGQVILLLENSLFEPTESNFICNNKNQDFVDTSKLINIVENCDEYTYINRQVLALKAFYLQKSKEEKECIENILARELKSENDSLFVEEAFSFFILIGKLSKAFSIVEKYANTKNNNVIRQLRCLSEFLKFNWNHFSKEELNQVDKWLLHCIQAKSAFGKDINDFPSLYKEVSEMINIVYKQINIILTKSLIDSIYSGFNPEVNEDEKKIKLEFNRYGFPSDLIETLDKIDHKFISASDDFDFKGCMDLIRSFTERLYKSIAISLDNTAGRDMDEKDSEKVAKFFTTKNLFSEDQAKILISLRHFLSNTASHRLKSRPEDARLSRNMTIEFSLYLIRRLKSVQSE